VSQDGTPGSLRRDGFVDLITARPVIDPSPFVLLVLPSVPVASMPSFADLISASSRLMFGSAPM
jgi:hypothetical protein